MIFSEQSVRWGLLIVFSAVFTVYLSAYSLQKRHVYGSKGFAFFMLTVALYSIGYAMELNGGTLPRIMDFLKFEVFWASFTAPAFLLFVIQFVKRKKINNLFVSLLFVLPVLIGIAALTNDKHNLIYRTYSLIDVGNFPVIRYEGGIVYAVQLIFLISVSLIAEIILLIHLLKNRGTVRKQSALILIAGFLPTLSATLNPERSSSLHLDTQPFTMLASGILLAFALFRFQMMDLIRVAREIAVDNIYDYLLILDRNLVILDINKAGKESDLMENLEIGSLLPNSPEFSPLLEKDYPDVESSHVLYYPYEKDGRHYKYSVSRVQDKNGRTDGYVILINENSEIVKLMKELEFHAIYDGLTGIFNRRHFINLANREIEIARRNSSSVSVIIFDIDHFKIINDNYGHPVGDRVLIELAKDINRHLRISEIFGRYGGEEFCIICSNTDREMAFQVAERLRRSIESLFIQHGSGFIRTTASFGVYSTTVLSDMKIESFFEKADSALYQAKNKGRNQTVLFSD